MARGLNGSTQYLQRADQTELRVAFPLTVGLWFKGAAQGNFKYLLAKGLAAGHPSYGFSTNGSGNLRFLVGLTAVAVNLTGTAAAATVFDSNWHHIGGSYDGANIRLYVDGVEVPATSVAETRAITYAALPLSIGAFDATQLYAAGSIAEVAIYSALLDTDEMRSLGRAFTAPQVRPASLVAYWPLYGRADPEVELRQGMNLTVTGATTADHCRIIRRPATPPAPLVGTQNAAATRTATATVASAAAASRPADASLTATGTLAADAAVDRSSAATLAAAAAAAAAATVSRTAASTLTVSASTTVTASVSTPAGPDMDVTIGAPHTGWHIGSPHVTWQIASPQTGWQIGPIAV